MQEKEDSSTGEQSLNRGKRGPSFEDKYVCLQAQAERDSLKEERREQAQERQKHD